jgi:Protein of unknown function (DUF3800)
MSRELIVYCDESIKRGKYFSNFYGGLLVESVHLHEVVDALTVCKKGFAEHSELKWVKINQHQKDNYIAFIDAVFDLVEARKIKIRLLFTQNQYQAVGLTQAHKENEYQILYYQLIKHAFGFKFCNPSSHEFINLRIFLDRMEDTKVKKELFFNYLLSLNSQLIHWNVVIKKENIAEIDSAAHVLAQAIDVIIGAMQFRLNDKHLEKREGEKRRGRRTLAREEVYKHINTRIQRLRRGFNIGVSTSWDGNISNLWHHPYRHWNFVARKTINTGISKKNK